MNRYFCLLLLLISTSALPIDDLMIDATESSTTRLCIFGLCIPGKKKTVTATPTASPTNPGAKVDKCKMIQGNTPKAAGINIVLVPSGFGGNFQLFEEKAKSIVKDFATEPALDATKVPGLNVFAVMAELPNDSGQYCWFGENGIDRMLWCNQTSYTNLAKTECGSGFVMNTLVVHNVDKYGGAGTIGGGGFGTTSINRKASEIAIHELGHTLFGLVDEYDYGNGDTRGPNCDVAGCPKWADLIKVKGWFSKLGCKPGCKGNQFFISEWNGMNVMGRNFMAVNERISCCKYLFHGFKPEYCNKFNEKGLNLDSFCRAQIWKGKNPVKAELLLQIGSMEHLQARAADRQGAENYVAVEAPSYWEIYRTGDGKWATQFIQGEPTGLYSREHVEGESGESADGEGDGREQNDGVCAKTSSTVTVRAVNLQAYKEAKDVDDIKAATRSITFYTRKALEPPGPDENTLSNATALLQLQTILKSADVCKDRERIKVIINADEFLADEVEVRPAV